VSKATSGGMAPSETFTVVHHIRVNGFQAEIGKAVREALRSGRWHAPALSDHSVKTFSKTFFLE